MSYPASIVIWIWVWSLSQMWTCNSIELEMINQYQEELQNRKKQPTARREAAIYKTAKIWPNKSWFCKMGRWKMLHLQDNWFWKWITFYLTNQRERGREREFKGQSYVVILKGATLLLLPFVLSTRRANTQSTHIQNENNIYPSIVTSLFCDLGNGQR